MKRIDGKLECDWCNKMIHETAIMLWEGLHLHNICYEEYKESQSCESQEEE
jgi:hypothetical protein